MEARFRENWCEECEDAGFTREVCLVDDPDCSCHVFAPWP